MSQDRTRPAVGDRERWADLADTMLLAVRRYASPARAGFGLPGPVGGYGARVDALEAFARTFLLAGFRLAGEHGRDPHGLIDWYAEGLRAGTDPHHPERWPRLPECGQAKVEAASLALVLDLTRPWLWDRLEATVQEQVIDYLAPAVGDDTYPRINWVWFRLVVQTFLRSVGATHSVAEMHEDLDTHDSFVRADGWLADGPERAFDHYVGWALHLFPTLWARMHGAQDLAALRAQGDTARLDRYLQDAVRLLGGDGSPLLQGRSLVYRFAAAAPFWVGAVAEVPSLPAGLLRRAAGSVLEHFVGHGAPNREGLLDLGWFGAWPALRQRYSGPGSPYWAALGMLGLALPAEHPVWTAAEQPLPVQTRDQLFTVRAPGWLVSATTADGVVRVVNHGTDHDRPGSTRGDSPLYARLGYSTVTSPRLDPASWRCPAGQVVVLEDGQGATTHRAGMRTTALHTVADGRVAVGASTGPVRWLRPDPEQADHGSGLTGRSTTAGWLTVVSLVSGPWEVRLVRFEQTAEPDRPLPAPARLRFDGWPLAGADVRALTLDRGAGARVGRLLSRVTALAPQDDPGTGAATQAGPLGPLTLTPFVRFPVRPGRWLAVLLELDGSGAPRDRSGARPGERPVRLQLSAADGDRLELSLSWPDGVRLDPIQIPLSPIDGPWKKETQ